MKLNPKVQLGIVKPDQQDLVRSITTLLEQICQQLNALTEGKMAARHITSAISPVAGTWAVGDVVYNSAPVEAGSAASKYVVVGWVCTVAGTPGTWVAMRPATGN